MDRLYKWSPELFYFLGWMITDGYVQPSGVHLEIAAKDKDALDYLHAWLPTSSLYGPYVRIKDGVRTESYRLSLYGVTELFTSHWKIMPNKTGKEKIPFKVPVEMMPHLFRGLFDGDGCVSQKARGNHEAGFVSSSEQLLAEIKEIYGGNLNRKIRIKRDSRLKKNGEKREPMYAWEFSKAEAKKLKDFMYVEGHYGLSRKKERMMRLFE